MMYASSAICLSLDVKLIASVFAIVISIAEPNCGVCPFGERNLWCYIFRNNGQFSIHRSCPSSLKYLQLVVATTVNLLVYALPTMTGSPLSTPKGKGKGKKGKARQTSFKLELMQTIDIPATLGSAVCGVFRAAR